MKADTLFYILITILIINFIVDKVLNILNEKHFDDSIPKVLADVYDVEDYKKSQAYKKTNAKFSNLTSLFSLTLTIAFFFLEGFKYVDEIVRDFSSNTIVIPLIFFGIIMLGSDLIMTPFFFFFTFIIEEKFGFNKTTRKIFILDKIKGMLMTIILGGGILSLIVWFYQFAGSDFWIYAWALVAIFTIFMNLFYSKLIVPIFNKQTLLENGELKNAIEKYTKKVGFTLKNVFVINGSKRSSKANAYFSGFGSQKRITLYDTLINDLETDEIVAVLAHEVGHYKRKHIIFNLFSSMLITGFTLWILSLFVNLPILSEALNISTPSFHIGLIVFGILYSPFSEITSLCMNIISRKFEYQADNYAKETFAASPLISSLKKLSKNSLSNLTPHPAYVFMHYSHPTLLKRVQNLNQ